LDSLLFFYPHWEWECCDDDLFPLVLCQVFNRPQSLRSDLFELKTGLGAAGVPPLPRSQDEDELEDIINL
jgi:hypothetical protein